MRKAAALTKLIVLVVVAGACSSVRTQFDFNPTTDFSAWRTYAWYPVASPSSGDPRRDNPLLHRRIVAAVDRVLAARGFVKESDGHPDFYTNYHLSTVSRLDVRRMNMVYFDWPYGHRWNDSGWGGVRWAETVVGQYEQGRLVIDFMDASERVLAWRGSGTRRLPENLRAEEVTRLVDEAVNETLRQFPPGS